MMPVSRRFYLFRQAADAGAGVFAAAEAVSSVGLSHPEGWLDETVDFETGAALPGQSPDLRFDPFAARASELRSSEDSVEGRDRVGGRS